MNNDGLLTWMHLYNCVGYIFPYSSITYKYYIQIKSHNNWVTKVVTPY